MILFLQCVHYILAGDSYSCQALQWRSLTNQYCCPRYLRGKKPAAGATAWVNHFENCANVNGWSKNEDKLKWLQVRPVGKAQNSYHRLGEVSAKSTLAKMPQHVILT